MHPGIRIGLIGDYNQEHKAHQAIPIALSAASDGAAEGVWIATDSVENGVLADFDGFWCVPGFPFRNAEGALAAIRFARMTRTPFLGTSGGFQLTLIEFARNVLGMTQADHQKTNPQTAVPLISPLGCALAGVKARVHYADGSCLRRAYGVPESVEEYHCSFGLNGRYRRLIEGGELSVAAVDDQNDVRGVELDRHPFFVATLFQPERRALAASDLANPLISAFVAACARQRQTAHRAAS
jgi:CTP synthase (UTP-ammonia lyase)